MSVRELCVLLQTGPPVEELPPPPLPTEPPVESAWERGLRHAKEVRANLVKTLIRVSCPTGIFRGIVLPHLLIRDNNWTFCNYSEKLDVQLG